MNYNVLILSEAELDIDEAVIWYELNQIGLGKKFYLSVNKSIHFISANSLLTIFVQDSQEVIGFFFRQAGKRIHSS
jgi:hypothetical protein